MLEKSIEDKVTTYARAVGCMALKLNVHGQRGWPDHLYICKGKSLFVEFKLPGEEPRALQKYIHEQLTEHGAVVRVIDNVKDGLEAINELTR